jgi:hypothetical protein
MATLTLPSYVRKETRHSFTGEKQRHQIVFLMKYLRSSVYIPMTDLLINVKGGDKKLQMVTGTYAHPDLVPHIASWVSPSFAIKVSRIVNEYLVKEEKEKILRLEYE